jgi:glycosyltransferase involved in cell wall biosynthesis
MPETAPEGRKTLFFSVIIPTYNRADKLRRALESLQHQTFRDFEVIVCDDGSTDPTKDVVSEFTDALTLKYIWEPNWGGPARPRNRGIEASQGSWICFLDADDWWYPEKLAMVLPETSKYDLIYHDFDIYTKHGRRKVGKKGRQLLEPVFTDLMTRGCSIVTSGLCVKKEILDKSGGFAEEPELVAIEDFDLWLRIARITEKFLYIPRSLGVYWADHENISHISEQYIARETALFQRYQEYLEPPDRSEAKRLLFYKIGVAKKQLGEFAESRKYFSAAMSSRRYKIRLYAMLYYLLSILRSRYTIP